MNKRAPQFIEVRRQFAVQGLPDAFASGPAESLSVDVISTGWKTRSVFFHGVETSLHCQSFPEDKNCLESAENAAGMESAFRGATAFSPFVRPAGDSFAPPVRPHGGKRNLFKQRTS